MKGIFLSAVLLTLIVTTAFVQADELSEAFISSGLIPDIIDKAPAEFLTVEYDSDTEALAGNELTPTEVQDQPVLSWPADPNKFYTVILADPDAPSRANPVAREWQHWLVGNIPGNQVEQGEVLSAYIGSAPPKKTGFHRYTFLVFEQPGQIKFKEPRLKAVGKGRNGFNIRKFAKKYGLGQPVAGNFYLAQWDPYVDELSAKISTK